MFFSGVSSSSEEKSKKNSSSSKVTVPKLDLYELNDDQKMDQKKVLDEEVNKIIISSRKPSLDVETTEEVSDVPEDIEEEIIEEQRSKSSTNNNYSEDTMKVSLEDKYIENNNEEISSSKKSENEEISSKKSENKEESSIGEVSSSVKREPDSSQRKENLLASVLNSFVNEGVEECLKMWKNKERKFKRRIEEEEIIIPPQKDSAERISDLILNEFLTDAINSCIRVTLAKEVSSSSTGVIISKKELGRVLELTKSVTSPPESSPRSPRSPSLDKYVSEIYREPKKDAEKVTNFRNKNKTQFFDVLVFETHFIDV